MNTKHKQQEIVSLIGKPIYNFGDILDYHADKTPNKVFVVDLNLKTEFTYVEFNSIVNKTINYLYQNGIKEGDILSIVMENSWVFLVFYFAGLKSGIIINPFPVSIESQDLIRYLYYIEPKLIAVNKNTYAKLEDISQKYSVVEVDEKEWITLIKEYPGVINKPQSGPDNPACLYYSSGTTGNPKGILVSHRNMLTNISSVTSDFHFTSMENHLVFLPLGHTASINYSILPCLFLGATVTLAKSIWNIRGEIWEIIAKHKITYLEMVPTALVIVLNMPEPNKDLNLSSLRWIGCGSAPLHENIQVEFEEKFKVRVGNLYGLSETGPTHIDYPLEDNWCPGSIGLPLSVNECKIVDDYGNELPDGEIGEIILKGENVFIGYYKNEEEYNRVLKNGYFLTGDLGYRDLSGRFYFVDREKDLVIKGGINIHPGEIEEILISHPSVGEVSVVGMPDPILGEDICAFLKLKNYSAINSSDLIKYCKQFLSEYKIPKKIIFVDNLPKGPSGKILKRKLREIYFGGNANNG